MTKLAVALNGRTVEVELDWLPLDGGRLEVDIDGRQIPVFFSDPETAWDELEWIMVDGRPLELTFDPCLHWIRAGGAHFHLEIRDREAAAESWPCPGDGRIKAPIPGLITTIFVEEKQEVFAGQPLLVLEAMKMENEIRSSMSGIIEHIHVSPSQSVTKEDLLVTIVELNRTK